MCKHCDEEGVDFLDFSEPQDSDGPIAVDDLDEARAFFMAVLEEAESGIVDRFKDTEVEFRDLVSQVRSAHESVGVVDPALMARTHEALNAMKEAKSKLDAGLARTAYKMNHAAFA